MSRLFGRDVLNKPEVIAGIDMPGLKLAIGLGPKSLKEIAEALYKSAYIDDPVRWLES